MIFRIVQGASIGSATVFDPSGARVYEVQANWSRLRQTFRSVRTGEPEFELRPAAWFTITQVLLSLPDEYEIARIRPNMASRAGSLYYRVWDPVSEIGVLEMDTPANLEGTVKKELADGLGRRERAARLKELEQDGSIQREVDRRLPPGRLHREGYDLALFHRSVAEKSIRAEGVKSVDRRLLITLGVVALAMDSAIDPSSD